MFYLHTAPAETIPCCQMTGSPQPKELRTLRAYLASFPGLLSANALIRMPGNEARFSLRDSKFITRTHPVPFSLLASELVAVYTVYQFPPTVFCTLIHLRSADMEMLDMNITNGETAVEFYVINHMFTNVAARGRLRTNIL